MGFLGVGGRACKAMISPPCHCEQSFASVCGSYSTPKHIVQISRPLSLAPETPKPILFKLFCTTLWFGVGWRAPLLVRGEYRVWGKRWSGAS